MTTATMIQTVVSALWSVFLMQVLVKALQEAYQIRLYAIENYGRIIHEFDPYFNYRATEYLYEHGWKAFCQWFDYLVWYPLGRPVGTTIYPGMQVTAVFIKRYISNLSLNDICCFIPAWFGVTATVGVAGIVYEATWVRGECGLQRMYGIGWIYLNLLKPIVDFVSKLLRLESWGLAPSSPLLGTLSCAVCAACIMSIVPAHLLRSIGGGYDNESIAMTAMVWTFWAWMRTMRDGCSLKTTIFFAVITGLAYFYMVAAWGGYVFVLNLVGVHAGALVLLGRYSDKLYWAYSVFYVVGTALATTVPVVGWTPLKSLEQIGPLLGFVGLQLIKACIVLEKKRYRRLGKWKIRLLVFGGAALLSGIVVLILGKAYFGPISSRVRGLFVKHTKTGNPLVDSVAEHQAASGEAYFQYLHYVCYLAPIGWLYVSLVQATDASLFLTVYGVAAYYFSLKMVRLILLTAPIASVTAGIVMGKLIAWGLGGFLDETLLLEWNDATETPPPVEAKSNGRGANNGKKKKKADEEKKQEGKTSQFTIFAAFVRLAILAFVASQARPIVQDFWELSHQVAVQVSHPTIIQKAQNRQTGEEVLIDDYRQAYLWLKDNTPEDARIMAWWDYGYQITAIGNRTTIADGNTWNHEHIALLGRTLTAPEREGHRIARHLADYILVWAGGGGDDVAKSPHLRRIANSVYRGLCREPTCREFGFFQRGMPTPDLSKSMLYKLHSHGMDGVVAAPDRFKEVYKSKYGKVRIFKIKSVSKESKMWVADPANRVCDAPGSWVCRGQYPPALEKVLKEKKDFKQLEDFNAEREDDSDYQREYMENLDKGRPRQPKAPPSDPLSVEKVSDERIAELNGSWKDTEATGLMWELISQNQVPALVQVIQARPEVIHVRSSDGRGPMWWAHEYGHGEIVQILRQLKVSEKYRDKDGKTPLDLN